MGRNYTGSALQAPAIKMVKTAVPVVQPKAVLVAEPKKKAVAAPVVATKQTKQNAKKGKKAKTAKIA